MAAALVTGTPAQAAGGDGVHPDVQLSFVHSQRNMQAWMSYTRVVAMHETLLLGPAADRGNLLQGYSAALYATHGNVHYYQVLGGHPIRGK